jgi:two-component system, response regulator YesN
MMMFKLLIVDDELLMRMGIRSMVEWEKQGFVLAGEASNGKEALDMARSIQPDLIITDIKMPLMDGLQLIREAQKVVSGCKFVILSYFNEFSYAKEAMQLGAVDYLIKNEITPAGLIQLLEVVRQRLLDDRASSGKSEPSVDYTESLSYLKENLFKDWISGLLDVSEAVLKAEHLHVRVRSDELRVIKFHLDNFERVRKKYVEKDEKLLRFSILNILEEMIPRKWDKEIVIESSSDYLLMINTVQSEAALAEIHHLCRDIQQAMKDFMNVTFSVGVSSVIRNLSCLRTAYREADHALRNRFFWGTGRILVYENPEIIKREVRERHILRMEEWKSEFRKALDSQKKEKLEDALHGIRQILVSEQANEREIREFYMGLAEIISTEGFSKCVFRHSQAEMLPYEAVLAAETWDEIHQIVLEYASQCIVLDSPLPERSYADLAADLIHRNYAEEISLISVANQINVNPSYLSRVFKQEKGENFISYLTRVRMERAKSILENRRFKISEVAEKVGYHNYPYFSKIFKKTVGMSPEEYRG